MINPLPTHSKVFLLRLHVPAHRQLRSSECIEFSSPRTRLIASYSSSSHVNHDVPSCSTQLSCSQGMYLLPSRFFTQHHSSPFFFCSPFSCFRLKVLRCAKILPRTRHRPYSGCVADQALFKLYTHPEVAFHK